MLSLRNDELKFNIKSSKPLEELIQKLRPEDYEKMNQPVPLDEGFVDYVQQQIFNRKETGILRSLKKLIQEPLEVDQSIFFRYQSDLSQNPTTKQSQRQHKNSDGKSI